MIKILVVDDQLAVRAGLKLQLGTEPGFEVVGEAENGREALQQAHLLQPDIVIMDLEMPVMNGLIATRQLSAAYPSCKVIMLSIQDDPQTQADARASGVAAFVVKDDVTALVKAIEQVASQK